MADKKYTVKQGDCISSIAYKYDLFPETIWDHPDNAELKKLRKNQNTLFPGDSLVIPDKQLKEEECQVEQKHRFRRKGVPERLRIQFVDEDGNPRKGIWYILDITTESGQTVPLKTGKTDNDGFLDEPIPPDTSKGEITLDESGEQVVWEVMLGHLDPIDKVSGIKARLNNMGYYCGEVDNELDEMTLEAIRDFQADHELPLITDDDEQVDPDTRKKIEDIYSG